MIENPEIKRIENLAYIYQEGAPYLPVVVFLPGFKSDMMGSKAQFLAQSLKKRNQGFLRLDYSGHGVSGGRFEEGNISHWTKDALKIIDSVTKGPLIVIGSSMGGWIALHIALARKERVRGYIGIAAAPDFTRYIDKKFTPEQKKALEEQGFFKAPSEYGEDLIMTRQFLEDGERQCLLDRDIDLEIPVTLLQGKLDDDVHWKMTGKIAAKLPKTTVRSILIEDGDHRLSRPQDLAVLEEEVIRMTDQLLS